MSCTSCFEDWVCKCLPYDSTITVNSPLPIGNYTAVLTDKFGQKYSANFSIYDVGSFELNISDFPEGLFSQFGGVLKLEVMAADGCTPVKIPMLSEYSCIEIEVKGGSMDKSTIGCEV